SHESSLWNLLLLRWESNSSQVARQRVWRGDVWESCRERAVISCGGKVEQLTIRLDPVCPLHHNQYSTVLTCRKRRAFKRCTSSHRSAASYTRGKVNIS